MYVNEVFRFKSTQTCNFYSKIQTNAFSSQKVTNTFCNFLPSDTTRRSKAHCRTVSCYLTCTIPYNVVTRKSVDSHCTEKISFGLIVTAV